MTIRCGCDAEGDEIVFGEIHQCSKGPEQLRACGCRFDVSHSYGCPTGGGRVTEWPYERVLSDEDMT
jgi:hypothetical protein